MPRMNSFRDVVAEKFCDDIFTVLSEYVESNPDKLESRSNSVESPDEATLSDIDIKFVDITNSEGVFCKRKMHVIATEELTPPDLHFCC